MMRIMLSVLISFVMILLAARLEAKPSMNSKKATFAGGCFWCVVSPFEQLPGVHSVVVGYTGGTKANPSYEEVSSGTTGHVEAVQVEYDPARVEYSALVDLFLRQIDPTDAGGQFVDRGTQYRPMIFYHDPEQEKTAQAALRILGRSRRFKLPIAVELLAATPFYRAEEYHQRYHLKQPLQYQLYRQGSGRDAFLKRSWGPAEPDPSKVGATPTPTQPDRQSLKSRLTPLQYQVTQQCGTEPAFQNEFWNNHREGLYVDVVSGEPLFSSRDKYESGTGWPSFTRPVAPEHLSFKVDRTLGSERTEVRSQKADSHLGHVFEDGPAPTGKRYCMNSAALRFIPKDKLTEEGYGEYLKLFQ